MYLFECIILEKLAMEIVPRLWIWESSYHVRSGRLSAKMLSIKTNAFLMRYANDYS